MSKDINIIKYTEEEAILKALDDDSSLPGRILKCDDASIITVSIRYDIVVNRKVALKALKQWLISKGI